MAIITTITEVQELGLPVTQLGQTPLLPDMDVAAEEFLQPYLGSTLLAALQETYDGTATPPDTANAALLPYAQKAVAAFAYWHALPAMHTSITDAGVRRNTSDNMPTAYRWEFEKAQDYLEELAYQSLERLLKYLELHADDYPDWTASPAFELRTKLLIRSGKEFAEHYRLLQPYRTYASMLSDALHVEQMILEPAIGKAFVQSFRDKLSTTTLEDEEAQAYDLMKKVVAYYTIARVVRRLPCIMTANGLMMKSEAGSNSNGSGGDGQRPGDAVAMRRTEDAAKIDGSKYLAALKKYLSNTASPTVLADYYNSDYYAANKTPVLDRGNDRRKIFRF